MIVSKLYCKLCKVVILDNIIDDNTYLVNNKYIILENGFKCMKCKNKLGIFTLKNKIINIIFNKNLVNLNISKNLFYEYLIENKNLHSYYKKITKINDNIVDYNEYLDYIIYYLNKLWNKITLSNKKLIYLLNKINN